MSRIVWRESTRNRHVGMLDDNAVVSVVRPQKNRRDGTKHDWRIVVLHDPHSWTKVFCQYDPRDLDSTKLAAEARVKWAIDCLYRALRAPMSPRDMSDEDYVWVHLTENGAALGACNADGPEDAWHGTDASEWRLYVDARKLTAEREDHESFVNEIGSILDCGGGEGCDDAARRLLRDLTASRATVGRMRAALEHYASQPMGLGGLARVALGVITARGAGGGAETQTREVAYVHGGETGWVRIGRYDSAERRSLWCRVVGEDDMGDVGAIELCSGREGDDAYVKLTPADPQWVDLCDVLLRVEGDCGLRETVKEPKS